MRISDWSSDVCSPVLVHNNIYSAFVQGSFKLTEKLSLTAGARMTRDDKELTLSTHRENACGLKDPTSDPSAPPTTLPLDACSVTMSASFKQPPGPVPLAYKLSPGPKPYATDR